MATDREWMARKLEEQRWLYEKYGKRLEAEHTGEFRGDRPGWGGPSEPEIRRASQAGDRHIWT